MFSFQENIVFWALWALTLIVVVHQTIKAASSNKTILGFVPPFCMMFGYFYVVQAGIVAFNLPDRLKPTYLAVGQGLALLCLIGTLWGWYKGSQGSTKPDPNERMLENPQALWYQALCAALIGIVGQYSFFATVSQSPVQTETSGYWYMLFHVAYPGLAICVSLISRRADFRGGGPTLLMLFLSALLMYPWIVAARRGPLFPFVVVVIYSFYLMRPHLVNRAVVIGSLALTGISMLMFVMIRDYSDTAATLKFSEDRLRKVTALDIVTGKAYEESDNEFLYHCTYVGAMLESDRYQWGTGYLSLATHWVPRTWWPEKPPLAQGWLDPPTKEEIYDYTGVYITSGASAGGIAETFVQLAWFTPLFWFGIGWTVGKVYLYGRRHPNRVAPILYVGLLAGSHWLISQGFCAAFVPVAIYVATPTVIFTFASQRRIRVDRRQRAPASTLMPAINARSAT